ncbi:MAG: hypothetical protein QM533_10530 [Cytophagales bacterium]|nr:hypothetical protein [Cytophagales bacterium]
MSSTLTLDALTSEALRKEAELERKSPVAFLRDLLEDIGDHRLAERSIKANAGQPSVSLETAMARCGL